MGCSKSLAHVLFKRTESLALCAVFRVLQVGLIKWQRQKKELYTRVPPPPLTTESPTTHTTDQHHVPIDPRAAELMPIHAARLALTRSVTQKAVDPSIWGPRSASALRHARRSRALTRGRPGAPGRPGTGRSRRTARRAALAPAALRRAGRAACAARRRLAAPRYTARGGCGGARTRGR